MESKILETIDALDKSKESCKIVISQCTFVSPLAGGAPIIRSCMETIDTLDLSKLFLLNRSPNTNNLLKFVLEVLNVNSNLAKEVSNNGDCVNTLHEMIKIHENTGNKINNLLLSINNEIKKTNNNKNNSNNKNNNSNNKNGNLNNKNNNANNSNNKNSNSNNNMNNRNNNKNKNTNNKNIFNN